jgi:hypothetical protein
MEQLWGHVSPATKEHAIMRAVFSALPVPRLYNEDQLSLRENLRRQLEKQEVGVR